MTVSLKEEIKLETNLHPSRGNTLMDASCGTRSIDQSTGDMNSGGCIPTWATKQVIQ
jgi:hypothetical protein